MIATTELYILKLVYVTLTLIEGHKGVGKQNSGASYLTQFSMDLGWV